MDNKITLLPSFGEADFQLITKVIGQYFNGLYYSDTKKLREIFHPDAFLKTPGSRRSLEQWLNDVEKRPIPSEISASYDFKLLSIEVSKDQAMVKVNCPLFDHLYLDYLGLLKEDNRWLIVNKMYTDLA